MRRLTMATALAVAAALTVPVGAQTPADHDAHHPDQKEAPATQPTPPAGQPGMGGPQGMMGNGGMMNMMGGKMPMMDMMGMMRQSGTGMDGMATIDHVEGRIAFLRTELKITDAQKDAWNAFADALRTNAKNLGEVRASTMPQAGAASQTLVDRLALQEKWLAARLEGTRAIKSALTNLVSTFSDDQKKTADEILAPHMGMMAMMSAMQSGQMGPGQMQPGMMMPGR
jgi:LTXXQ motif family protein